MKTEFLSGTPKNWKDLKPHQLSSLVEFGAGIDVSALAGHMRQHGYDSEEAIILFENQILDGRHKHIAAQEADVVPTFRTFTGPDPLAYVAKKIHRQHLTSSQRAMLAAKLANGTHGGSRISSGINATCSQETAGKVLNVSSRSVRNAIEVTEKGTEKLNEAVMDGTVSVTDAAKIADEPGPVQNGAVKKVRKKKAKTAKTAVAQDREAGCEPDPQVDHFKKAVPDEIQDVFATVAAYRSVLNALAKIRKAIDEIPSKGKKFLDTNETDRLIHQAHANLRFAMPYTECVKCRRKLTKDCKHCRGQGWLNETTFNACGSEDDKKWLESRK